MATGSRLVGGNESRSRFESGPDRRRGDEAGHAGGEVDDVPARVVERALLRPVAAAPDEHRVDGVGAGRPGRDEDQPRLEVHPPEHAAEEEQRGDGGEHELEVGERRLREVERRDRAR